MFGTSAPRKLNFTRCVALLLCENSISQGWLALLPSKAQIHKALALLPNLSAEWLALFGWLIGQLNG